MRPVIKRGRQAAGVGGRCDSGQILLTEHPSYLPYKDICLRKQTGGRQRGRDAHLNSEVHPCAHTKASTKMHRSTASSVCAVIFVCFNRFFFYVCV